MCGSDSQYTTPEPWTTEPLETAKVESVKSSISGVVMHWPLNKEFRLPTLLLPGRRE